MISRELIYITYILIEPFDVIGKKINKQAIPNKMYLM
jgi:hypothetical protein